MGGNVAILSAFGAAMKRARWVSQARAKQQGLGMGGMWEGIENSNTDVVRHGRKSRCDRSNMWEYHPSP